MWYPTRVVRDYYPSTFQQPRTVAPIGFHSFLTTISAVHHVIFGLSNGPRAGSDLDDRKCIGHLSNLREKTKFIPDIMTVQRSHGDLSAVTQRPGRRLPSM